MESDEEELIFFQRNLLGMLKSLSYSCSISHKIFEKLHRQLDNNYDLDVNLIEDSGIKIMNNLKTLRGNMAVVIKYMADEIKEINKNHSEKLFDELSMIISLWNTSVVNINEDNEFTFTQLCDKNIMVDESEMKKNEETLIENNPNLVVDETELKKDSCVNSEPISAGYTNDHNCETPHSKTLEVEIDEQSICESSKPLTSIRMSLKPEPNLSDSQNTNDDWNDTLKRNGSISTFNNVLIECSSDKDVKVENDNFDEETIHLNQDQDDSFPELQMEPSQSFMLHDEDIKLEDDIQNDECVKDFSKNNTEIQSDSETGKKEKRERNNKDQTEVENQETFINHFGSDSHIEKNNESDRIEEINPVNEETCINPVTKDASSSHKKRVSRTRKNKDSSVNEDEIVEINPASKKTQSNKSHKDDVDSGNEKSDSPKTVNDNESDKHKTEKNACGFSIGLKIDTDNSDDEADIHSIESDSQNKKNTDAETFIDSTDMDPHKKKNSNPLSKAQIDDSDSSDDDIYIAPTQKIVTKVEGLDSPIMNTGKSVEDDLFQKPTQKITVDHDMNSTTDYMKSGTVLDSTSPNNVLIEKHGADPEKSTFKITELGMDSENTTPSKKAEKVPENLHSKETNNSDEKTRDEAIIDDDETNKTTVGSQFCMENFKFESDDEIDKINELLNEHSYSCASASDLEDSLKEPLDEKTDQEKQDEASKLDCDSNVHNEHNYSSPILLSEAEAKEGNEVAASDYDSDETDIDRVIQRELMEVPDSQDGGSRDGNNADFVEWNNLLDGEHVFGSHESNNSYEFDVTENVNHLGARNDDISKRNSSRGSHIIDECDSDSSSASSKKIDDSGDDEEDALLSKIVDEDEASKPNNIGKVEDDVLKELENTLNGLDKTKQNGDEPPQTKEHIEEHTDKAKDIQDDDVVKELENTLKELDNTKDKNDYEPAQTKENIEEQTEKAKDIQDDDVVKELEDTLKELDKTKDENVSDHESPQTKEDIQEHTEKAKDIQDEIAQIIDDDEQNYLDETVIIGSDNDSKDALMDIIMEEILSDTERVPGKDDPREATVLDYNIKSESNERNVDVGDEILSLLKNLPEENVNPIDEEVEAEKVLKMLQESSLDESDDDSDVSILTFSDSVGIVEMDDQTSSPDDEVARLLKKHNMVDCSVKIERMKLQQADIEKHQRNLEDNLEWLCDLTNLQNKRKNLSPVPPEQTKRHRKKRKEKSNESSSSGCLSDSEVELAGYRSGTPVLPQHLENKLDEILANTICNELRKEVKTNSESSSEDSDDSATKTKKKSAKVEAEHKESDSDIIFEDNRKSVLSKEEQMKKAWKNDPLLRGRFSSPSGSYESKTSNSRKNQEKKKQESEESDSDSDTDVYKKNKSKFDEKEISPIKRNIPVSDTSDSDSDIEFISQKMKSPVKAVSEEFGHGLTQKGRRNIRSLISEDTLAEATKRANREELERIERLKEREKVIESLSQQSFSMSQNEELEVTPLFLDLDEKTGEPIMKVHEVITAKLKDHQRKGIQFMWDSCYESVKRMKKHDGSGCILAHCMGLGKTFQVLALVHTLFANEVTNTKHVLVVCPLSTVSNWKKEVKWAFKGIPTIFTVFTIATRKESKEKYEIVKKWRHRKKSLLVLGYEGFETLTNESKLDKLDADLKKTMLESLVDPGPDLVICDEGHLLRNKNANKSLALNKIKTKRRIVLTGTPLQNNLSEYYHMVQIVKPNLLGNSKEFKTNFVNPITNGQYEDSTAEDITLMMKRTHVLHRLLAKTLQRIEDSELEIYLPKMVDYAVFIQLTQTQIDLYNYFSDLVKDNKENNFFGDFQMFQYICTHPQLLAVMDKQKNKRIKERDLITNEDDPSAVCRMEAWWRDKLPVDGEKQIEYGNKMVVALSILQECEEIGDKVLLFSQSLGELDLIEHFLKTVGTRKCPSWQKKIDYYRMDGTVSPEDRTFICDKFNNPDNARIRLLLMSTKVGGLGLNLTAANRVVIMTVNWNPSYDTQSVFRVYRFGQTKPVYVYRLISLDTMEERVYQRGVTKLAVAHRVVDKHQITNHYQRVDLQELYACKPNVDQERKTPNVPEDQMLAKLILRLPFIYKYHEHKALLANRPEFNLSKEELAAAWQAWKDRENEPKPVPPPPKASVLTPPQKPIQTSPDFNNAYNLGRNNINILTYLSRNLPAKPSPDQLKQYYVPIVHPNGRIRPQIMTMANSPTTSTYRHIPREANPILANKNPTHLSPSVQNRTKPPPLNYLRAPAPSGALGGTVNKPEPMKKLNPAVMRPNPTLTNALEGVRSVQTPTISGGSVNTAPKNSSGIVSIVDQNTSSARNAEGGIVNRNEPNTFSSTRGMASGSVNRAEQNSTSSARRKSGGIVNRNESSSSRRNSGNIVNRNEPTNTSSTRVNAGGNVNKGEPKQTGSPRTTSGGNVNDSKVLRCNPVKALGHSAKNVSENRFASNIGVAMSQTGSPTVSGAAQKPGGIMNSSEPPRMDVGGDVKKGGRKSIPTPVRSWKKSRQTQAAGAPPAAHDAQDEVRLVRVRNPAVSPFRPRLAMTSKLVPAHLGKRKSDLPLGGAEKKVRAVDAAIDLLVAGDKDGRAVSVPNELIRSLGHSGVTIRKVANVQDVITLD